MSYRELLPLFGLYQHLICEMWKRLISVGYLEFWIVPGEDIWIDFWFKAMHIAFAYNNEVQLFYF